MACVDKMFCLIKFITLIVLCQRVTVSAQYYNTNYNYNYNKNTEPVYTSQNHTAIWCTVSPEEQEKCKAFVQAIDREISQFGRYYISLQCHQAFNKDECMVLLDQEKAHMTTLDAGEVFVAGRYHSLIPIMQEIYTTGVNYQYAVAVIKNNTLLDVTSLHQLRGRKACFAGVGTLAGWVVPIHTLMTRGGLEVIDCNNHVKSAIEFFGPSCAVNSLVDRYNPLGDNSDQLCKLCIGDIPGGICTNKDPYADYEGAFKCLVEAGEIAFLVHTTVQEMTSMSFDFNSISKNDFELFCPDGSRRRNIDDYQDCNWGRIPSRAVVVSSATKVENRVLYQKFLGKAVKLFSKTPINFNGTDDFNRGHTQERNNDRESYDRSFDGNENNNNNNNNYNYNENYNYNNQWNHESNNTYYDRDREYSAYDPSNPPSVQPLEVFDIFESVPKYGSRHNLLFSDAARDFVPIGDKDQTYKHYLGHSMEAIMGVRDCPVGRMKLCVTSTPEKDKCEKMKVALKAQLLKPELSCFMGYTQINCMQAIRDGQADVAVLDTSDVYTAGLFYNLIPFMAEMYNLLTPEYYVVAVAKENDNSTDITYLKNKNSCHTGINTAAGWVYPMAYLLSNGWIRGYGCDSIRAAAEYFMKSCIPGAHSIEYNVGIPYENMCGLCHGVSNRYCRRDATEDFYGHTGAIRCLVEGGGDVAFVKHTTVFEITDGKRKETWARNTFTKDFQLLCPDGTRKATYQYRDCNLGKVKANAIVARGNYEGYNETEINAYINLFIYAQQFYGRKETDEFSFSMFYSNPPYTDLIFQDAAQQLVVIPPEEREYSRYLGSDFMRARRIVDCNAGASEIAFSLINIIVTFFLVMMLSR
ncbi:melanotransferrin [Chelonus insularis]|uniref:melanotransferrin n=1 Tax=Chelonus insularis TaxID=460826 RepID=UPI00158D4C66|nr:melanotransferrin [Chelonus insularis]